MAKSPDPTPEELAVRQLTDAGLRSTPVRRAILVVLAKSSGPLDVPALLAELPPHTDGVTVYRTLNTFVEKKLVHRVRGDDRGWRFAHGPAKTGRAHQHPHFVCESCGKVECLADSTVPATLAKALKVGPDYSVDYTEVIVHGACADCR